MNCLLLSERQKTSHIIIFMYRRTRIIRKFDQCPLTVSWSVYYLEFVVPLYITVGGLNYYALIVYIHVFTLYLYLKKYFYVITSVDNFCIYNYIVDLSITP